MLSKLYVDFDPTVPSGFDKIGSFIIGASGTDVVTTTDLGGGVIGLDVNVGNMTLDADAGVFLEDDPASSGQKGQSVLLVRQDTLAISTSDDGDYGHFKSTNLGELYTHDTAALAMLTTIEGDLDTANASLTAILADTATIDSNLASLVKTEDVAAGDGYNGIAIFGVRNDAGTALVGTNGDFSALSLDAVSRLRSFATLDLASLVADDAVSSENPLLVGAVAHTGAAALSAVSASLDKVHFATDLYRRQWVNESCSVAWQVTPAVVGILAAQLDTVPLASRTKVTVINRANQSIYIKNNNTVTAGSTTNGWEIPKFSERDLPFSAALPIYAIGDAASLNVSLIEVG